MNPDQLEELQSKLKLIKQTSKNISEKTLPEKQQAENTNQSRL
ncbi:unnamed protein product, partial [marine sediment metagenome]